MTEYSKTGVFNAIGFLVSDVNVSILGATLKTNIGKIFVEKNIPLRNATNKVLEVSGIITGLSQTSGQTQATAIENDRASLESSQDGYYHTLSLGKYTGNYVIIPGSLVFPDEAERAPGSPYKFQCQFKEW